LIERVRGGGSYSILDVGCAQGSHLTVYPRDVKRAGVEPALSALPKLAERQIEWLGGDLKDVNSDARFDVISILDVLEHVQDPAAMIRNADRLLHNGGVMAIVTGNIHGFSAQISGRRWLYYSLPEHVSFPSWDGLRRILVGELGYKVETKTWIANENLRLRYVVRFGLGLLREVIWRVVPGGSGDIAARDGTFPFFVDSNMILIVRKPIASLDAGTRHLA
jgi:SAM-dependent methyltransferase